MKSQLFTVQQFADLHEIGKRTLHFYDETGLFSPSVKKPNGYRYYSIAQGPMLEMILTLRELDMPIATIKQYMENRSVNSFSYLIEMKQKELDLKITELRETKSLLSVKQEQLSYMPNDCNFIEVVTCKRKNYAVTPIPDGEENYITAMIRHGKSLPHHLFNMELGTMNHTDNLIRGQYNITNAIFSNMGSAKCNHIRLAGDYIRAFHKGNFEDLAPCYKRILDYCNANNLIPVGYSYEVGINDLCIMSIDDFITMIEIPVEHR